MEHRLAWRAQYPRYVFEPPRGAPARPPAYGVQFGGNRPQRLPSVPQMPDLRNHGLLGRLGFQVGTVCGEPVPVGDVADALALKFLRAATSN